ncbi:glycosyltransferase [Rufibacter psychrotolerans]|uniref:glycosyltransferase n=1 Tax=Rufibacter psychrotolerans TaxID=2812556 RepID=UPI0019672F6B|nr:glycosyltransferase [Rufibacter sp. SYSU D00308]
MARVPCLAGSNMGKSIVFTVTTHLSHDQRMQRIAGTLAQAGFDVTLVGRELPHSPALQPAPYRQHRLRCFFLKGPFFYLEYNLRLLWWLLFQPYDLIGTVDADTALAGVFASRVRRKPLVYDAHELFPEMPEVVHRPLVKKVWAYWERQAFAQAQLAYTVSESLAQYFQERYRRKVGLVRNMPRRQTTVVTEGQEPPYFIYQGALNEGRGLEITLEALQQVPARLMICGAGPLEERLQALARQLGVEDKVTFTGNVLPAELARLTAAARAGIMLLEHQGLSYYYSLANKFFDYVQAGIPQVCVSFPEYQRFNARHRVALLTPLRVEEVRAALLTLLHNPETYHQLRQNCLLAREEWCWEQEAHRLVDLYAQFT